MKRLNVYCYLLCTMIFFAGSPHFCAAQSDAPINANNAQKGESPSPPRKDEIAILKTDSMEVRLLKERYNTAIEELSLRVDLYNGGRLNMDSLYVSMERVGKSKLALAVSPQERVAAWESLVALYRDQEDAANRRFQGGAGFKVDVLATKYARLDAELSLLRAKKVLEPAPKEQRPSTHR